MEGHGRIARIDELRGALILLVLIYHLLYDITLFFPAAAPRLWLLGDAMRPLRAVVPGLFILLCGMCTHLSRNNMRRGLWCALFAGGIRLVSGIVSPACPIRFGILHLLALCLLLQPHVWYVGLAAAVGALLLLAGNLRLCHKLTPELQFHVKDFSPHAVWEVLSTGSWTALNNLGNLLNSGLDLLITNLMLNATVMGQISVAKSLETIVSGMIMKISTVFRPRCLRLYAEDKMEELTGLLKISMRCTGGFCNLVVMGFFVCGHDFMALWLPGQNTDFLFRAGLIVLLSDIATGAVQPLYYVYTLTQKLRLPCCVTILMGTANVLSMYILLRYTSATLMLSLIHI